MNSGLALNVREILGKYLPDTWIQIIAFPSRSYLEFLWIDPYARFISVLRTRASCAMLHGEVAPIIPQLHKLLHLILGWSGSFACPQIRNVGRSALRVIKLYTRHVISGGCLQTQKETVQLIHIEQYAPAKHRVRQLSFLDFVPKFNFTCSKINRSLRKCKPFIICHKQPLAFITLPQTTHSVFYINSAICQVQFLYFFPAPRPFVRSLAVKALCYDSYTSLSGFVSLRKKLHLLILCVMLNSHHVARGVADGPRNTPAG